MDVALRPTSDNAGSDATLVSASEGGRTDMDAAVRPVSNGSTEVDAALRPASEGGGVSKRQDRKVRRAGTASEISRFLEMTEQQLRQLAEQLHSSTLRLAMLDTSMANLADEVEEQDAADNCERLRAMMITSEAKSRHKDAASQTPAGTNVRPKVNLCTTQVRRHHLKREVEELQSSTEQLTRQLHLQRQLLLLAKSGQGEDSRTDENDIRAILNPNADASEAMLYFNNLHKEERTAEEHIDQPMKGRSLCAFKFDQGSEPLFLSSAGGTVTAAYQSMAATIPFVDSDGTTTNLDVVVDSGAAYTAISEDACKDKFPLRYASMRATTRKFHDASKNDMPVLGECTLTFKLGDCELETQAYVFPRLGAAMLLGSNTLTGNGLVIDSFNRSLHVHPDLAGGRKCATALRCERSAPSTPQAMQWTHTCMTATVECRPSPFDSSTPLIPISNDTDKTTGARDTPPDRGWSTVVTTTRDHVIREGARAHFVLLEYQEFCRDASVGLQLDVMDEFAQSHPNLTTITSWVTNGFCRNTFIKISNTGGEVTIPKGTAVATARYIGDEPEESMPAPLPRELSPDGASMLVNVLDDNLPFEEGGRPTTNDHLLELGLDLSKCIDPNRPKPGGGYHQLSEVKQAVLRRIAMRWWWVWARDARAPETSRLVVIDIPTGEHQPIAQKPYPIPYAYREAVLDELRKLIDGGLIEPTISQWASPILVRLKKDSDPDKGIIKLKIIVDYRRLNQVTIPDAASLGEQDEMLDGFGGRQRFNGICDAAGGFYQYSINPSDRHKTAFVLPTALGGTSFQWRVAPYGLTRNPAGYSRGMMFALQGLGKVALARGSTGGSNSWIDDISMHADSFEGFADLFDRILGRIAFASMQLKASKCFLLHEKLEVLGYYVTPDGLIMQESKIADIVKRDADGNLVVPETLEEIRTFLGAVQFYRRFIPRLSLMAAPMTEMLKKNPSPEKATATALRQSFEAIISFLRSDAVVAAPDLQDPKAEYVICTDACDVAAGGVLLQWQHPSGRGPGPPAGTPLRGGQGSDPIVQSWRSDRGWILKTIGYYSKTFDVAQKNYPTFDKEAAAILFCIRRWAKLITCRPTTVYTDSTVASSMLHKHLGPPRLQRWGMELGTFLPFLKIGYRKGADNGMADFLSRYPSFRNFVQEPAQVQELPSELFDMIPEAAPLFTHRLGDDDAWLAKAKIEMMEAKDPERLRRIWQAPADDGPGEPPLEAGEIALVNQLPSVSKLFSESREAHLLPARLSALREVATQEEFWAEQGAFEEHCGAWETYVRVFEATCGRAPVLYDLCCGEGGFSRGAQAVGVEVHGFEKDMSYRKRYEHDHVRGGETLPSGLIFHQFDIADEAFWAELTQRGRIGELPPPDFIHASPPCRGHSRLRKMTIGIQPTDDLSLDGVIARLKQVEAARQERQEGPLVWQVENVPESETRVTERVTSIVRLSGLLMGLRVVRQRLFYCNYPAAHGLTKHHLGKYVGSRGLRYSPADDEARFGHLPTPNMYGVYSKPSGQRGTMDEWHNAMGFNPNTFSLRGLTGALPLSYGRLLVPQMAAAWLHRAYRCPVWPPAERTLEQRGLLHHWSLHGYTPGTEADYTEPLPPLTSLNAAVADTDVEAPPSTPAEPNGDSATPELYDKFSDYDVSRDEQLSDPRVHHIIKQLESTATSAATRAALSVNYTVRDGKLWRWSTNSSGEPVELLVVPQSGRGPLLRRLHALCHRGHEPLYHHVRNMYWWFGNIEADCLDYTNACTVCADRKSRNMAKAPVVPVPTPSRPFNVIHVDHKGPLPRSGKFSNILVVVCALTRFTLYIPVKDTTADETLKQLMARVFCVFGFPLVVVSDNGPAFVNAMHTEMARYFGYRHVPILPYNAQANGAAEASVKRIKLLLDRHTKGYAEWHKVLPLAQLLLNSHRHTGTRMSPYMALFGYEPVALEQLENPALLPTTAGSGSEWLNDIRRRMLRIHRELQTASDAIKKARAAEADARRRHEATSRSGEIKASTPYQDHYVRILRGSHEDARYVRKHGHGEAWKHKYKVLDVRPHAVRLEVPTDGSVPRINPWQLIRRCEPADEREEPPLPSDPVATETGVPIAAPTPQDGDSAGDDDVYEIDKVVSAEKVGNRYRLWIKWVGYHETTPMWKHDLLKQTCNAELLSEINDAVERCRLRLNDHGAQPDDDPVVHDEEADLDAPEAVTGDDPAGDERGRPRRTRRAPAHYTPSWYVDEIFAVLPDSDALRFLEDPY